MCSKSCWQWAAGQGIEWHCSLLRLGMGPVDHALRHGRVVAHLSYQGSLKRVAGGGRGRRFQIFGVPAQ
eukprot:scaffold16407_cov127-Isochrysis_galbana.AAC.10